QTKKLKQITTKLGRAEQRLHVSEDKYRQLVENVACIILRMDKDGRITFFNEFAQKFYGYTEQEILGKNIIGTIVPQGDSFGQNLAKIARDIKKLPGFYAACENENIRKNGQRVWVSWANKAIRDEDGSGAEILCVGHDITERKQMENELRLLATVVLNSNDAITVQDLQGNIISWNLGAERIYGYSKAEAIKMNISRIIPGHKQDEMMTLAERALRGENIKSFETQHIAKNNRILDISLTATLLKDENGKPFALTTTERDITERRRLEKEILDLTERERKLIGQEIHDSIGQVLTGIAIKCKGLSLKLKDKSSEEMEDALVISKLANKAIAQARDIAKMLYPVDIQTGGLVSALKTLASDAEEAMGVTCRFRCGKSVSVKNLIEAKQIYRIVQEAITNAVKHGKAKNISINLRLTKKGTVLTIENDGLDFPKLSPNRKGFGLKIMEYRTDLIGGSLDIRKGDKGGTIVTVCFLTEDRELSKEWSYGFKEKTR
ncbi:MAG: PAS domain S-box protein, partial [Phycisphaerae bacterium]|nr:PAS domain S-box protein [Phycisphaerae bacterium]